MVCTEHTNVTWDTHAVATAACESSPDEPGLHDTYSSPPQNRSNPHPRGSCATKEQAFWAEQRKRRATAGDPVDQAVRCQPLTRHRPCILVTDW